MHRPMDMRVPNSLHSGSSLSLVAVLVAVKMRTATGKMPTVQGFRCLVAVVAVLSTSKLNFEKLYIQRGSITKIMDCVYEVGKYDHRCHQVAKILGILGFWQWQL